MDRQIVGAHSTVEHVFVYGTLRLGEANDIGEVARRHGIAPPEFVGSASAIGCLHDFGSYPGLVLDDEGSAMVGEVFQIASGLLPFLDEIEEFYPGRPSLFERTVTGVKVNGEDLDCHVYVVDRRETGSARRILGGDWVAYRIRRK